MKDGNGNWTGISIDLWRQIAAELKLSYEWRELDQCNSLTASQMARLMLWWQI